MTRAATHPHGAGSPAALAPRLLDMHQAAAYLGCSYWTVRDYVLADLLPVVSLPALRPREGERPRKRLRRVLIDREDLDRFVERVKNPGAEDCRTRAPQIEPVKPGVNRGSVPRVCPDLEGAQKPEVSR